MAQEIRVDVGGGWGIPISSVEMGSSIETEQQGWVNVGQVSLDQGPGINMYGAIGFVQSISENLGLGVRARAQRTPVAGRASEITSSDVSTLLQCGQEDCSISNAPDGQLRTATIEGRLFLRTIDWIEPYFLVGLGIVQTQVEGVRLEAPSGRQVETGDGTIIQLTGRGRFSEIQVMDAGGDVGFGASLPITAGLSVESEIRVTGSLPGGRDSSLSVLPLTVGLSYGFDP